MNYHRRRRVVHVADETVTVTSTIVGSESSCSKQFYWFQEIVITIDLEYASSNEKVLIKVLAAPSNLISLEGTSKRIVWLIAPRKVCNHEVRQAYSRWSQWVMGRLLCWLQGGIGEQFQINLSSIWQLLAEPQTSFEADDFWRSINSASWKNGRELLSRDHERNRQSGHIFHKPRKSALRRVSHSMSKGAVYRLKLLISLYLLTTFDCQGVENTSWSHSGTRALLSC